MSLVYRKITEEVYKDAKLVEINSNEEEIKILHQRIDLLQQELQEMKSLLLKPQEKEIPALTDEVQERQIANCNQKEYKRISYSNYEFKSVGRFSGKVLFDIPDIVRLSKFINDFDNCPTMKLLKENTVPFMHTNSFAKLVWNYQQGNFKEYLSEYRENIKFTVCNNHLCIDGRDTKLRPAEVFEMINILINSSNHYGCVDNLVKEYSKTKPLYIKIIADFVGDSRLLEVVQPPIKKVNIENNPEKRRQMGL